MTNLTKAQPARLLIAYSKHCDIKTESVTKKARNRAFFTCTLCESTSHFIFAEGLHRVFEHIQRQGQDNRGCFGVSEFT